MENNVFRAAFLHPRYWLLWLGFAIWWLLVKLPYPLILLLARGLGYLMYCIGGSRKKIAQRNIELCFPHLSGEQRERLLKDNFFHYGLAFFEVGISWWWSDWRFNRLVKVEGLENLEALNGQGVLLTAIHFTSLEIGASAIGMHLPLDGMHRPHKNLLYDYIQSRGRLRRSEGCTSYPRKDVRQVLKALKSGRTLWYAPDQDYGIKQGVFVPFMGINAATVTATARFASAGRAKVVPLTQGRIPGTFRYRVKVHPPLKDFPVGDDIADATTVNQLVERMVLEQPEAYMWVHRRFKTRPEGEPSLYGRS